MLIIKHVTNLSDDELNREFSENVYLQAFCGFDHFLAEEALESSTLTKVRQRLGSDFFRQMEMSTYKALVEKGIIKGIGMLCDATVVPEKISYPNDVGLLEKCRRRTVDFIRRTQDFAGKKYRTYSRSARNLALSFAKKRKKTRKMIEKAKRKALNFLARNIRQAKEIVAKTAERGKNIVFDGLEVVEKIYGQQKEMYTRRIQRIENRIVSVVKPHVRPIKRGKNGKDVEFGPKGAFSYIGGFLFMDRMSYDNFSEAGSAIVAEQVGNFEKLLGRKPESFTGDNLYGTRKNRELLDKIGVRAAFKPLGRRNPIKSIPEKRWLKKKHNERNRIEGAFGHAKEHLGLKPIRYKSSDGGETWIRLGLMAMNLKTAAGRT